MATEVIGPIDWDMDRDDDGNRTYHVVHLVKGDVTDGPSAVLSTSGLPRPGDEWNFFGDFDPWATCRQPATIRRHQDKKGDPHRYWTVQQTFSNKGDAKRCKDQQIDDPLLQPMKVSGSFTTYTEEATHDRFGRPIVSSSWEMLRGPQAEFDVAKASVKIQQNVADLQLPLLAAMNNTVNDRELWGLPRRSIKLTVPDWDTLYYGNCSRYFSRTLLFDILLRLDPQTGAVLGSGHDRDLLDEGNKCLKGHLSPTTGKWVLENINGAAPDRNNPLHFAQFKDPKGENCRVVLDGMGRPATLLQSGPDYVCIQGDTLGIPLTDINHWIPLNSYSANGFSEPWDSLTDYVLGDLVFKDGFLYVAIGASTGADPAVQVFWVRLGRDLDNQGVWQASLDYVVGDWVASPDVRTNAAFRHVEKYNEANFLLLGIPSQL